jgi:dipeptidyl-peptidase 4
VKAAERQRFTPELVARFPRPGTAIPGKIRYSPDSRFITYLFSPRGDLVRELWRLDLAVGKAEHWLQPPGAPVSEGNLSREEVLRRERLRLRETGVTDYIWAERVNVMLLPVGGELYRWKDGSLSRLAGDGVLDPQITPDGRRVFFARDGDVWTVDGSGERRLTSHPVGLTNGIAEYVAQEELDRLCGYWPSPAGDVVAYEQVDESSIPIFPIVHQATAAVEVEQHRYPFAGAANATVRLGLVKTADGSQRWLELPKGEGYIARVDWHPDGRLFLQWLSRDWQRLELVAYDREGRATTLLTETVEPWINLHNDLRMVEGSGEFTWSSERSGFRHLYLYAADGRLIRQLTAGDWPAEATVALDSARRQLYFAGWQESPLERQLFRVSLDGGEPQRITPESGSHGVAMAPDFGSFIDVRDSREQPPSVRVRGLDGATRHVLHPAASIERELEPPELHRFRTSDGIELYAALYRPKQEAKAPVIVSVYGGPGPQMVNDSWAQTVDLRAQLLAEQGFIVLKVDNRGSARRGLRFEAPIHGRLGDVELRDQVEGLRWLDRLGIADLSRVGIYGWSYGGYLTVMALLTHPDVFKAGVAGAPVTFWEGYDTAYTEKYLRTPQANPNGYRQSSALTHVDRLRAPLLLVHGMIDENVHFRHTARLMQALIDAGKPFETLLYPNERHMPRSERDRADMERRLLEFFQEHL